MAAPDPDQQRHELIASWERSAAGWGARADAVRSFGMPVSRWLIDRLALSRGDRLLELAAGPGDTGFLASELIQPEGALVSSDAAEAMLDVARSRAVELGIRDVEFKRLELEWIDLPTASVDAIVCRWGLMFALDPEAALREMRRVVRPGGALTLAVWDAPAHNPWATIPTRALVELGHLEPPDPTAPGMFVLAASGRLRQLLQDAGFTDVNTDTVDVSRSAPSVDAYLAETLDLSGPFAEVYGRLGESERAELVVTIARLSLPFTDTHGALRYSGRSIVASANA